MADCVLQQKCKDKNIDFIVVQIDENLESKLETVDSNTRKKLEKTINFLHKVHRKTTLDEIGIERIVRVKDKLQADNPGMNLDLGFKHFSLKSLENKKITELEEFDPELVITSSDDILNSFGVSTVLTTWLIKDSYEFNAAVEKINFADYVAYRCGKHLYLLNMDFGESELKALIEKYDADSSFNVDTIVLFGYSFTWAQKTMLEDNLKKFERTGRNIKVNVITRY